MNMKNGTDRELNILAFHHIRPDQKKAFERLIQYLLNYHRVLNPVEAGEYLHAGARKFTGKGSLYLITFDDGYKSQAYVANHILDPYGIKAVFFICPGIMDIASEVEQRKTIAMNMFCPMLLPEEVTDDMLMMTWPEVEILRRSGHVIGAHTLFHKRLSLLSGRELFDEIVASGKIITERLHEAVDWFAFPFGDTKSINAEVLEIIRENYHYCCSAIRGKNSIPANPHGLLRQYVDLSCSLFYQRIEISGGFDFIYRSKAALFNQLVERQYDRT